MSFGLVKRINGAYAKTLVATFREWIIYRDSLSKVTLKTALLQYFHLLPTNKFILLYQYLLTKYGQENKILDFGTLRLPMPNKNDELIFMHEFIDILAPSIFTGRVFPHNYAEGSYEQFGVNINPKDIVIDAGANIGMFSAYAASKGAQVYAFEPMLGPLKYLHKTKTINEALSGNINIVPLALSNKTDEIEFIIHKNNIGASSSILKIEGPKVVAKTTTLDEWAEIQGLPKIDFIKADIEGAERDLLKGATIVLKKFKPKLAICTYHLKDDKQVLENIILSTNPAYTINHSSHKLFAY